MPGERNRENGAVNRAPQVALSEAGYDWPGSEKRVAEVAQRATESNCQNERNEFDGAVEVR